MKKVILPLIFLAIMGICICFADVISPHDPQLVTISEKLLAPSREHLFGTDHLGRDIFSRMIEGAKLSLLLAIVISILEIAIGGFVGLLVGWYEGSVEKVFLWLANIMSSFPSFLLSLATVGILGQGLINLIVAIVSIEWLFYARVVANIVKSSKQENFVKSARIMKKSTAHIVTKHLIPFTYKPILVLALMNIGSIILMISGFSFLGVGVQPDTAEWGMMLYDARPYFRTAPWTMMAPGLMIFLTVMSFNVLSDVLESKSWVNNGRIKSKISQFKDWTKSSVE